MERIFDTPMQHGTLVWSLQPPARSMVLVVKATFDLRHQQVARLASHQVPCSGMTFWDDDPTQSPRLDSDFALVKRVGECFLAGTCHPPDAPATHAAIAFGVGPVQKAIGVIGDRRWKMGLLGRKATDPEPFESMPLRWERAFGGAGFAANPLGRGVSKVETEDGAVHPLPNLEDMKRPVSAPGDRPTPSGAFPIPPTWSERLRRAGTYDDRYAQNRFPYFPADFDPAFYQAAPADQRLSRYWAGNEEITLKHLSPEQPFVVSRLPGLRARGFVQRTEAFGGRFEEIPLALDTITVDADVMRAYCVWRGSIDVTDDLCSDVARLFVMHEPLTANRSVLGCRHRMEARLRLEQIEQSGFVPETPQEDEDAGTMSFERVKKTLAGDPKLSAILAQLQQGDGDTAFEEPGPSGTQVLEPETPPEPEGPAPEPPPVPPKADEVLDDLFAQLADNGVDLTELRAQMAEPQPMVEPDPDQIRDAFAQAGVDAPPEVDEVLKAVEEVRAKQEEEAEEAEEELELSARDRALMSYAEGRPLTGDYTDVDLSGESLVGLVASGAILRNANLSGCELRDAKLDGAMLAGARLDGAELTQADLSGADLVGASLVEAKLSKATLTDAVLDKAVMVRARLDEADLTKAEVRGANLSEVFAEGLVANEADFSGTVLRGLQARGSKLVEARLTSADASGADLSECDLTNLRASYGARFDGANLRKSTIDFGRFRDASMADVNLSFASLKRANFTGASMPRAIVAGAVLVKAKLIRVDLSEARVQQSDLMGANLLDAMLERADLRGSSFYAAELFRAKISGARWELADLSKTKLEGRV